MDDQVAVITGAGSGIGKAIAVECSRHYGKLCLVGRTLDKLEAVARQIRKYCPQVDCYRVDLSSLDEIRKFSREIQHCYEGIHLLVHSAGVFFRGSIEYADIDHFDEQYFTNVRGPYYLTQLLLTPIRKTEGQIVFINSSVSLGENTVPTISQYAATKQALKAVTDILREEVNAEGVRVVSIYPGRTATPMQEAICKAEGVPYIKKDFSQPEDVARVVLHALALPKTSEIKDIVIRPMNRPKVRTSSCTIALPAQLTYNGSADGYVETYDQDLAHAIVKAADQAVRKSFPQGNSFEIVKIAPRKALFIVGSHTKLAQIPWLKLVEIAPGRHLIDIPAGISFDELETAILELIRNTPSDESTERFLLEEFVKYVSRLRRYDKVERAEILIVESDESL